MKKMKKLQPIQIYESDSKTKFMSYGDSLSKGKSVAGYVVYEVDKNAKYESTSHLAFMMTSKRILKRITM